MAPFGGYEMPLWYSSAKDEHLCVLTNAGLFDTSHMAAITIEGADASSLLQKCFSKDLKQCVGPLKKPLTSGLCTYGVFLNEAGHVIDDAILYKFEEKRYLCVVNAGMGEKISRHLQTHATSLSVQIRDLTDQVGKMDLQGPKSGKILQKALRNPDTVFEGMRYFSFKGTWDGTGVPSGQEVTLQDGTSILLSRSGYTGEFGFEIFCEPERTESVWNLLLEIGKEEGVIPCGLAARDSLRAGAVLPLSHQDIGGWPFLRNPWIFALPYNKNQTGFTKDFVGGESLLAIHDADYTLPFIGKDPRKVSVSENTRVLDPTDTPIGNVLTCVTDMGIGKTGEKIYSVASPDKPKDFVPKGLSCGFVKVTKALKEGDTIKLSDGRRRIPVTITYDIRPDRTARVPIRSML